LDELVARFQEWVRDSAINVVLHKAAYSDRQHLGFPAALQSIWNKTIVPMRVETERRFLVHEGDKLWKGSLDRIVWLGDGVRVLAADVLDFKTDMIEPENEAALVDRTKHYRPQIEAYRRVVARLAQMPEDHVAARLIFTSAGKIVEI
jgi:ATP-dependent exoDNAse (exonuclease V) beta subunit